MIDGVMIWEARVGIPEGTTDLERMVDIDGKPLYFNGTVYAVSFQGGVMAIQPNTGRSIWYQELSSTNGAGGYGGTVAVADDRGIVKAFNASVGTELWSTDEYENRSLNAPAVSSEYVAVADFEGYLHLLSRRNGETVGREEIDGSGVRSPTIIHNDQIIILDNSGGISAFNVNQR
jgi:outer membrane protein assembly factor BamB